MMLARFTTAVAAWMLAVLAPVSQGDEVIRVATYNIKFLDASTADDLVRKGNLIETIALLDADAIGLQEIDDIGALDPFFPPDEWIRIIDDDSGDDQDVAAVVRRSVLRVVGAPEDASSIDATDDHFLCENEDDFYFPNKRDVLALDLEVIATGDVFTLMVVHTKSRYERKEGKGRATNDARREGAASLLVSILETTYDGHAYAIVGDFNDNPDDRSLNILETGDPDAPGGEESDEGPFLFNLTEPLLLDDHVSFGRTSRDINGDRLDTRDPGARDRNNLHRGSNTHTGDNLFDQILVSPSLRARYVLGSCTVFDRACAARGNSRTRASDHLPVVAEFVFVASEPDPVRPITIAACLPDPEGPDAGRETVTLANRSGTDTDMTGYVLRDRAGHTHTLDGTLPAGGRVMVILPAGALPLNNSGDEIELLDPSGRTVESVVYTRADVSAGRAVVF